MAIFGKLEGFQPESEEFSAYLERADIFKVNDITEDKKVPIFLNSVGCTTYSLLRGLVAPEKHHDKPFTDLAARLQAHFEPARIVIAERFSFHKRNQNPDESVAEYLGKLRRLAARCSFGSYLEEALRDRLVCGLQTSHCKGGSYQRTT